MTRARLGASVLVGTIALLATAGPAAAGAVGAWTRVTDGNLRNIDEVAVARTPNGVLHAVWASEAGTARILHVPVSADGQVGPQTLVASGYSSVSDPDLVVTSSGLRTFYGAIGSTVDLIGVYTATAPMDGSAWTPSGGRISSSTASPQTLGAGIAPDGTPYVAWTASSFDLFVRSSLDPVVPDVNLGSGFSCCFYDPDVAVDPVSGEAVLAFFSNVAGNQGVFVRSVAPAVGATELAPGSATDGAAIESTQRTPIVGREGGGVYVAYCSGYPSCASARVWRVDAATAMTVGRGADVESVTVASAPDGRLWALWENAARDRLYAARSNESATTFGRPVAFAYPPGADTVWRLLGEGSLGSHLDVFAHAGRLTGGNAQATWHTQVLPGLTLTARGGATVSFTVTDAGDPVAGAKIKVGGRTLTTNAAGKAAADLPAGRFKATASKPGYASASVSVRSR